jgi:hypothetical protein
MFLFDFLIYLNCINNSIAMKGFIFNTPFYTKVDWHTGKLIMSKNGQYGTGYGEPGSPTYMVRTGLARSSSQLFGDPRARAKVTANGKRMIMLDLMVGEQLAGHTYGGKENAEARRQAKHRATEAKLAGSTGMAFRTAMGPEYGAF